jgi:tetratricopeptide (TPR) repeat protein
MTKKSPIALAALLLAVGTASLALLPQQVFAQASASAAASVPQNTVRKEMGKPFAELEKLITAKQFPQALEKMKDFDAFEKKTPYEEFSIQRMFAVIASNTSNTALLASSFDAMINSSFLSMPEKLKFSEGMAGTYYNEKKYDLSKKWAMRTLELDPNNKSTRELLPRIMYLQDDFAGAVKELTLQLETEEKANRVPSFDLLHLIISCHLKTKNTDGYTQVLERMVTYYPKKEYWGDLLYRVIGKPTFSERLRLDWYRLLLTTDNLEDAAQYAEMAELALFAGLPLEAKKVVEAGFAANLLGTGKDAAKHKPLREKAIKQAADDAKAMESGDVLKAIKTSIGMVNTGYNYVLYGQFEKGIALIEQGIAKGGLKAPEEAKLHLGMAYLQSGNKAKAAEIFKTLQGSDGASDLGRYWLLIK